MIKPYTTLFMLVSVDGKISTGDTDLMDVDRDFPKITALKEGLQQYYDIEKTTDFFSFNTGRVFAKVGMNKRKDEPEQIPVTFVIIDNKPHLIKSGVIYLSKMAQRTLIVTTNPKHAALRLKLPNVEVISYKYKVNFMDLFERLARDYGAERVTIQSGGTLNATLVREGLIDRLLLVVAPAMIGGENTATLMDGESLRSTKDLKKIKTLQLIQAKPLKDSYLLLEYEVRN